MAQADNHLRNWLKARFNLEVSQSLFGVTEARYHVCRGDYDYDVPQAYGPSIMAAAVEYAACYDGELCDVLNALQEGA